MDHVPQLLGLAIAGAISVERLGLARRLLPAAPGSAAAIASGSEPTQTARSARAIAVLPFTNLSRDPQEEYFADALTDELISTLSQVHALRVVARTSVFAFKGENRDIREIGRALGVGTVLEGSVLKEGSRLRLTAQLISANDGLHLWAESYEREGTDVFAIQSDLALRIAVALEAELTPAERARLASRPTDSPEAHAHYLKGRHFWNQRTRSGYDRAIEHFERAIDADPRYARAYAGLASVNALQGLSGQLSAREGRQRMQEAARKAVELDGDLAEARAALGSFLNTYEWDSEAAEREYMRALELDPSYGSARHFYGNLFRSMGRLDEAIDQKRKAVELDPLAPQLSNSLGYTLLEAGRPDEALEAFRNVLELDSTYWGGHAGLGSFHEAKGQLVDALGAHQRAVELGGRDGTNWSASSGLARVLARIGHGDEARRMLAELEEEADRTGIADPDVATVFLALDDVAGALEWLERSYRQRHPSLRFINWRSEFARLEDDPRYTDIRRRIGLPDVR